MIFAMPTARDDRDLLTREDRQEIIDATIRYCWAIDSREYAALGQVFTEDVICEHFAIGPPFSGVDRLETLVAGVLDPLDRSQHMVSNHEIEADEGGARSRCYFHAQHVRKSAEGGPHYIMAGTYHDHWRKTPVGWRSCRRKLEVLWTEGNPAVIDR
jgi:ketosteroid isomerase-like protein